MVLTGGYLVVACCGAWQWTESPVLRWLCRAASNAASHLVWLSSRLLWVGALDSSWCFPLYCVGKLIKGSFFTAEGVIVEAAAVAARLPASWLTHPPFNEADVIHMQLQSWQGSQDARRLFTSKRREKHTFFFGKEKILSQKCATPKARCVSLERHEESASEWTSGGLFSQSDAVVLRHQYMFYFSSFSKMLFQKSRLTCWVKHVSNYFRSRTRLLKTFFIFRSLQPFGLTWLTFSGMSSSDSPRGCWVLWLWHYYFLKHFFLNPPLATRG